MLHRPDPWRRARSLADLAELTRRWLLGDPEVPYHPNGYDELDPESEPIRGHLAALNRAGFLTECSQPAHGPTTGWDGATYEQRAAVQGFTDRETADRIEAICREEGLTCIRHSGAGRRIDYSTAQDCTWRDGRPVTDFGARLGRREVRLCMSGHGDRELRNAEQITVIDPDPQPSDRLFSTLARRLEPAHRGPDMAGTQNPPPRTPGVPRLQGDDELLDRYIRRHEHAERGGVVPRWRARAVEQTCKERFGEAFEARLAEYQERKRIEENLRQARRTPADDALLDRYIDLCESPSPARRLWATVPGRAVRHRFGEMADVHVRRRMEERGMLTVVNRPDGSTAFLPGPNAYGPEDARPHGRATEAETALAQVIGPEAAHQLAVDALQVDALNGEPPGTTLSDIAQRRGLIRESERDLERDPEERDDRATLHAIAARDAAARRDWEQLPWQARQGAINRLVDWAAPQALSDDDHRAGTALANLAPHDQEVLIGSRSQGSPLHDVALNHVVDEFAAAVQRGDHREVAEWARTYRGDPELFADRVRSRHGIIVDPEAVRSLVEPERRPRDPDPEADAADAARLLGDTARRPTLEQDLRDWADAVHLGDAGTAGRIVERRRGDENFVRGVDALDIGRDPDSTEGCRQVLSDQLRQLRSAHINRDGPEPPGGGGGAGGARQLGPSPIDELRTYLTARHGNDDDTALEIAERHPDPEDPFWRQAGEHPVVVIRQLTRQRDVREWAEAVNRGDHERAMEILDQHRGPRQHDFYRDVYRIGERPGAPDYRQALADQLQAERPADPQVQARQRDAREWIDAVRSGDQARAEAIMGRHRGPGQLDFYRDVDRLRAAAMQRSIDLRRRQDEERWEREGRIFEQQGLERAGQDVGDGGRVVDHSTADPPAPGEPPRPEPGNNLSPNPLASAADIDAFVRAARAGDVHAARAILLRQKDLIAFCHDLDNAGVLTDPDRTEDLDRDIRRMRHELGIPDEDASLSRAAQARDELEEAIRTGDGQRVRDLLTELAGDPTVERYMSTTGMPLRDVEDWLADLPQERGGDRRVGASRRDEQAERRRPDVDEATVDQRRVDQDDPEPPGGGGAGRPRQPGPGGSGGPRRADRRTADPHSDDRPLVDSSERITYVDGFPVDLAEARRHLTARTPEQRHAAQDALYAEVDRFRAAVRAGKRDLARQILEQQPDVHAFTSAVHDREGGFPPKMLALLHERKALEPESHGGVRLQLENDVETYVQDLRTGGGWSARSVLQRQDDPATFLRLAREHMDSLDARDRAEGTYSRAARERSDTLAERVRGLVNRDRAREGKPPVDVENHPQQPMAAEGGTVQAEADARAAEERWRVHREHRPPGRGASGPEPPSDAGPTTPGDSGGAGGGDGGVADGGRGQDPAAGGGTGASIVRGRGRGKGGNDHGGNGGSSAGSREPDSPTGPDPDSGDDPIPSGAQPESDAQPQVEDAPSPAPPSGPSPEAGNAPPPPAPEPPRRGPEP
jgi:Domain of unknown function (DUF6919)